MLRFASLGSGSKGNATLVETENTMVMIDCGYSVVEVERRIQRFEREAGELSGLLLTHEHSDHIQGAARLSRRFSLPVWTTTGTYNACRDKGFAAVNFIDAGESFSINDLHVQAYPVPHDAKEPCQFVFSHHKKRLGLLTDVGCITPHIVDVLSGCHALMLECNYDSEQLHTGPYPAALKRRIDGRLGHLSNDQAADLLEKMDTTELRCLIGMHLSLENNHPDSALAVLQQGIESCDARVFVACQENGFGWEELN